MIEIKDGLLGNTAGYDLNSLGHRCKELSELNFKKYFLFVGDQIGLGFDSPIYETFPYLISKKLNHDYYNLCVFNGGADAIKYNTISWLFKYKQIMPKAIFVASEFVNSLIISDNNLTYLGPADYNNDIIKDFTDSGNNIGFYRGRNHLLTSLITNNINIPIYYLNLKDKEQLFDDRVFVVDYDGDLRNQIAISDKFIELYNKNNSIARP